MGNGCVISVKFELLLSLFRRIRRRFCGGVVVDEVEKEREGIEDEEEQEGANK